MIWVGIIILCAGIIIRVSDGVIVDTVLIDNWLWFFLLDWNWLWFFLNWLFLNWLFWRLYNVDNRLLNTLACTT